LVRAGPGAGKTRLLVGRAAALAAAGLPPERLCLLTFTRKAAAGLAERLSAELAAGRPWVGTFHALGREVLALAGGEEPAVAGEEARQAALAAAARAAGIRPGQVELAISRFKQTTRPEPPPELAPTLAAYHAALAPARDLDDLVREAALALAGDPGLAAAWRGRWQHILVDEYQDVNPAQVALLAALTGPETAVTAIGDPDQAIYAFRGADPGLFHRFGRDFPGAASLGLATCYRLTEPLLAAARGLMRPEGGPELVSAAGPGRPPLAAALGSAEAEARWIARRAAELIGGTDSRQVEGAARAGGYAPRDMAVLYRVHAQAPLLRQALEEAGVPVQAGGKAPLAEADPLDHRAQRVSLLSMHGAKGLEWPVVFIAGVEEGLLPYEPPGRPPAEAGEERRLLYVAMTRARERLFLSRAGRRTLYGQTRRPGWSPLLAGLPPGLWQKAEAPARRRRAFQPTNPEKAFQVRTWVTPSRRRCDTRKLGA
jgi:DNA helicase-2/ATP-dependent DNA helicase PcrA